MTTQTLRAAHVQQGDTLLWAEEVYVPSPRPVTSAQREHDTGLVFLSVASTVLVLHADDVVEVEREEVEP